MKEAQHSDKSSRLDATKSPLVPQKAMLWRVGASRSTFWRLLKSMPAHCPAPIIVRGRKYWQESDVELLRSALTQFRGRTSFDNDRKRERAFQNAAEEKRKTASRRKRRKQPADAGQLNLFS